MIVVGFETVRVAAVQATPVILDADATVDKAIALLDRLAKACADGAASSRSSRRSVSRVARFTRPSVGRHPPWQWSGSPPAFPPG